MSKLDPQSLEQLPESIDFFNVKPTLAGIEQCSLIEYPTAHPISDGPINFRVNTGQCFVDFSKSFLVTQFRILKKEGQEFIPIKKNDPVSLIQAFGSTFIKNIKVQFNKQQVYHGNDLYAYNAYMRRRLGIGGKPRLEDLQSVGYFEDDSSQVSGSGFDARRDLFVDGKSFKAVCPLDVDIFQQKKLFLNDLIVDIEIIPNSSAFTLIAPSTQEYRYQILDCKLYVKTYMLNPELHNQIQENLEKGVFAKYNYTRTYLKKYYISSDRQDFDTILFTDKLPKRIFVGLVDAKAFNGHIGMSPFEFAHYGLKSIHVTANGIRVPWKFYDLDWDDNNFIRAYKDLSDITEHGISLAKYTTHSNFYGFDLQVEHDSEITEIQKTGTTHISLSFADHVPANGLQLIIFAEFDSILPLNCSRNTTTYSSMN